MNKLIQSFEEGCEVNNIGTNVPDCSGIPEQYREPVEAFYKLMVIADAQKQGKKQDWDNAKELKFQPWFDLRTPKGSPAGSGFSCYDFACDDTGSFVGSRLSVGSAEEAKHMGTQHIDLYKALK